MTQKRWWKFLDSDIEYVDDNESSFCSLWSRIHKKIDCVELFSNPNLGDDYFFNRLNISNRCSNVEDILNLIKQNYTFNLNSYYIHMICDNENSAMWLALCDSSTDRISRKTVRGVCWWWWIDNADGRICHCCTI